MLHRNSMRRGDLRYEKMSIEEDGLNVEPRSAMRRTKWTRVGLCNPSHGGYRLMCIENIFTHSLIKAIVLAR